MKAITVKPIEKKDTKLTEQQKSIFHNRDIKICKELNITDKNDRWLFVGDTIRYCDQDGEYQGVLLYNPSYNPTYEKYGLFFDMWYGDDKYNPKSYGKFVPISLDNSDKMKIEKIMV